MKNTSLYYGMNTNFVRILGALVIPFIVSIFFIVSMSNGSIGIILAIISIETVNPLYIFSLLWILRIIIFHGAILIGIKFLWNLTYGVRLRIVMIIMYLPFYYIALIALLDFLMNAMDIVVTF